MSTDELSPPASLVRRAAAIARGPHACPGCECPTWTEPPVPWRGLRDYVVRCEACERPLAVRLDRGRLLRRRAAPGTVRTRPDTFHAVDELLRRRDRRAFCGRVACAAPIPLLTVALAVSVGSPWWLAALAMLPAVVAGALFGPWLAAAAWGGLLALVDDAVRWSRERRRRPVDVVGIGPGRWDQWLREQRLREHERAEQPDAVLQELERVLDERELRRVRAMAERGEVPPSHLDDLLRFRRAWSAGVA